MKTASRGRRRAGPPGRRTVFAIRTDFGRRAPPADESVDSPMTDWRTTMDERPARILVVDDDPLVQQTIHRCLELEGYEVVLAADGRAALAETARQRPDLVILDVM